MDISQTPPVAPAAYPGETICVASDVDDEQAVAFCLKCFQPIYPDQAYRRVPAIDAFSTVVRVRRIAHPGYDAFIHDDCGAER